MVYYKRERERERESEEEVNTLTPLFESTGIKTDVKMVEKKGASYLHSVSYSLFNERSIDQSSGETRWGGGRGKVGWLVHSLFAPKRLSHVREIWRRILVWIKPALEPDRWGQPAPGKTLTRKKERKKSENWEPVKEKYNLNRFPSTILKYWKVICIFKKREKL